MKYIKKVPLKCWVIIVACYVTPFPIQHFFVDEGIRDMRWFFYVFPVFFFAYYFGLRGGILSSLLANAFFLLWELGENLFEPNFHRPGWESYLIFAISLISLSIAIGIGLLANKLSLLSNTDPLTRLFNRRYLHHYQIHKKSFAILFIDLDRFKLINDVLGHCFGDKILQLVSDRLKIFTGKQDIIARLGGDEFVFIMYEDQMDQIQNRAKEILYALSLPYFIENQELTLTASIGISQSLVHGEEINELIARADIAMYQAKQQGKNRYRFFTSDLKEETIERLELEKYLYKAIQNKELVLYYQPRVDLGTNHMIGMEALIRWQHPTLGLIPPLKFIPIAEETGLIVPIGEWVLYTACKQNKELQNLGFPAVRVSVNISGVQFQINLVDTVKKVLEQTELDPQWLELEITESELMNNVKEGAKTLLELKRLGVYLSIDDFGTGFSSLFYLQKLPVDCLKIDKSFVDDLLSAVTIVKSIISLGHDLNMEVIAEGIEKQEQAMVLQKHHCDQGQGYLYSPPVPIDQLVGHFDRGQKQRLIMR